jgi:hypothetical protein
MKLIIFCVFFLCIAYYPTCGGMVIGGSLDNTREAIDIIDNNLCTPDQWEGFATSWYPELDTLALANISYDFQNRKLAVDVAKIKWKEDDYDCKTYSMIFRFDKKKAYFFYDREDGKNCTVRELEHEFEEWCIPKDAKCMGPFTIGGSLEINAYKFNISGHGNDSTDAWIYFESTAKGIPVNAKYGSKHVKGTTDWYDITAGIGDPNRFEPPDFCADVTPAPWRHGHRGGKRTTHSFSLWHLPYRV